jgi:hypothetical protein
MTVCKDPASGEGVLLLRGEAGDRQISCSRGIVSGSGMVAYGRGLSTSAAILETRELRRRTWPPNQTLGSMRQAGPSGRPVIPRGFSSSSAPARNASDLSTIPASAVRTATKGTSSGSRPRVPARSRRTRPSIALTTMALTMTCRSSLPRSDWLKGRLSMGDLEMLRRTVRHLSAVRFGPFSSNMPRNRNLWHFNSPESGFPDYGFGVSHSSFQKPVAEGRTFNTNISKSPIGAGEN